MKFLVLDGNSILNRAFYGIHMLSNKQGQMTNGIYGFLSTFFKLKKEIEPDYVTIAFDLPKKTFRHELYKNYKATRKKMPDELASQLSILKELLSAMGYKIVTCEGYEADDILGTFANFCQQNGYECVLATGDRDSLQLVSDKVNVRIATTKSGKSESILYNIDKIREEYGVNPENLIDIKALQGDTSDNIPGVKGIGEKTARELVQKFHNLDYIYENIDSIDIKESVRQKLILDKNSAYLSYKLGKINKNIPIEIDENDYTPREMNVSLTKNILTELEFFSFIESLNLNQNSDKKIIPKNLEDILNENYENILNKLNEIYFLVEYDQDIIKRLYIKIDENIYFLDSNYVDFAEVLELIINESKKITYDIKKLKKTLNKFNINMHGEIFDIMLASYILDPSEKSYDIDKICNFCQIDTCVVSSGDKIAKNLYFLPEIYNILNKKIRDNNQIELLNMEHELALVLADMENIGFLVDKEGLLKHEKELNFELENLKNSIYNISGMEFNINSPKQLGVVLFEKLGLPAGKKTKSGYSTNAQVLEKLRNYHEIVNLILEYREIFKLKSTYCEAMVKMITPEGRIHTNFSQVDTRTGRISSSEPNLQNIPIRTQRGAVFRNFFHASPGFLLIDADYSQIELRVLAHMSNDVNMIEAFNNHNDIHAITASQILNIPINFVNSEMRFRAKAVNFGILYGMSAFSLSQDLKISVYDAQKYIDRYLNHYQGIEKYMKNLVESAKNNGFVETLFGRRRYLPELNSSNFMLRSSGERIARNMPIQGTAADIIKIAMINVNKKLKDKKSRLILQVHDELIVETHESELDEVKNMLKFEMENAVKLCVPLEVNIGVGKTWFDAKT